MEQLIRKCHSISHIPCNYRPPFQPEPELVPFLTNTKIPNTLKDENRADFLIVDMGLPLTHTGTSAFLIPDTVLSELGFTLLTEYQRSGMPSRTCGNHLSISHFIPSSFPCPATHYTTHTLLLHPPLHFHAQLHITPHIHSYFIPLLHFHAQL